jgi:hypothetical protein
MDRTSVKIEATDNAVEVSVGTLNREPEHFSYTMPGMLTGADLRDVLEACGIEAEYTWEGEANA